MRLPQKIIVDKDEFHSTEADKLSRLHPELTGPRHLVSCPKVDFKAVSTQDCVSCGFFLGFFPKDRRKPLAPGNVWSVCAHPVGREVLSV